MCLLLLAGCTANSQIQWGYDVDRDSCQAGAQARVDNSTVQPGNRATALKTEFAKCMRSEGWKLTSAKAPTTAGSPIHTPSGPGVNPVMSGAAAPAAASAARTTAQPTAQPATVGSAAASGTTAGPGSTPATIQTMPQTTTAVPQGASTYQPATPPPAAPGRYFGPR